MGNLPNDPIMLMSVLNTKLRDGYDSLEALCEAEDVEEAELVAKLQAVGYLYQAQQNQFKRGG